MVHPYRRILVSLVLGSALLLIAASAWAQYNPHPRIWLTPERIDRIRIHHWQADSYEWDKLMDCAARSDIDGAKAQALAYAVTGDESWAEMAVQNMLDEMIDNPVMSVAYNTVGSKFNAWAVTFDWLYHSPHFTSAIKQQVIDYVSTVPKETGHGWNQYWGLSYFNGASKMLWGPPLWGMATKGDNPLADDYIDTGYWDRWVYIRNALGYADANIANVLGGCMPEGMDYGSGTMSHILRYLDALKTASGIDEFDDVPAIRQYLDYFLHAYYYTEDFIRRPEHGNNAHKRGAYLASQTAGLLIAIDHYRDTEEAQRAAWWLANIEGADRYPAHDYRNFSFYDVIFSDPTIPTLTPYSEPLVYYAQGNGMYICRSEWASGSTKTQTWATFRAGNWTWFNQNQWDQGNFCIYSHGADLVVDGGVYGSNPDINSVNYQDQTIAHNSLLIKDPEQLLGWAPYHWYDLGYENSGGQNRPWRETLPDAICDGVPKDPDIPYNNGTYVHDMSDVTRNAHNERYTYAFADLTNAYANPRWEEDYADNRLAGVDYRPKVDNVTRHWIYLRERPTDDDEYFVTFDRVSSTDASFQKKSLLHFIGEPVFTGGNVDNLEVPGHIETWNSDRFEMNYDGAVLHASVVLPAGSRIRKVGGDGYEYWVNGHNWDSNPDSPNELGGVWRVEIMPPDENLDDVFFTVLHPDWQGAAAPAVTQIASAEFEGASFDGWVLMYSREEQQQDELAYSVEMGGAQRHLIFDMTPGFSYRVYRNGDPTPIAEMIAGSEGIVEFESPGGGSFQITQGVLIPDTTPPTGSIEIMGGDCLGEASVMLRLTAVDDESGMDGGLMRFSNDGVNWSATFPYQETWAWTLAGGDGAKTVYALFADVLGNWMTSPVSDGATLDDSAPAGSFDIVEDMVELSVVTLSCSASDAGCGGPDVSMSFSNDGIAWSPIEPLAGSVIWDLAAQGEDVYTVYARYGDGAGNWSDPPLSDTVVLDLPPEDQTPPELYDFQPEDGATGVLLSPTLAFMVRDLDSGVDVSSLALELNGQALASQSFPFSGGRYMVTAIPPEPLAAETAFVVRASAADLSDPPNAASHTWQFTTGSGGDEAQPPAPPTGLSAGVDDSCTVSVNWEPSAEPSVIAYRVSYGAWPEGVATELEFQDHVGTQVAGLEDGEYWFAVRALDNIGQESADARLAESVLLACDVVEDPGEDPEDPPAGPLWDAGEIWPPGVMVDDRQAPLRVHNLQPGWTVRIFSVSGRLVRAHRAQAEGEEFTWNLLNSEGGHVSSGLYLVRVFGANGQLVNEGYYLWR